MMRFRCPSCQNTLELDQPTQAVLCPACQQWCRIPLPEEFDVTPQGLHNAIFKANEDVLDVLPAHVPPQPPPVSASDEEEFEDVAFEIVEEGRTRKPKRRRRRRRRSSRDFDWEYWVSPALILLIYAPGSLIVSTLFFLAHPAMGLGCTLITGGGIWFALIAAEDGWVTALLVMFVPFYAFYYMLNNWERVAVPSLLQMLGIIIFIVSIAMVKARWEEESSAGPREWRMAGASWLRKSRG